ncbi:MAG: site-specific DNA-methyltransferase [Planctomycetes bacterium]|nr:site-specific DNA-methyltransferase [Planctomycetota bacterium]
MNLVFTSPPFPLIRKKKYGNRVGEDYLSWLRDLAPKLTELLADDGSIVIEIGNAWEPGSPTMSTLPLRALLAFQEAAGLQLCQHMICHNTARLPGPAEWVTVRRIRLKDSYTHVWWMAKTAFPKADNRRVLLPYSAEMKDLLRRRTYNAGERPSEHIVGEKSFLTDNGGAISASLLEFDEPASRVPIDVQKVANTRHEAEYVRYCKSLGIPPHPARMQPQLAAFFISFLTSPGDTVIDPFAGSNTTGWVAEQMGRQWLSVEASADYVLGSKMRFQ